MRESTMRIPTISAIIFCLSGLIWAEPSSLPEGLISPEKAKALLASDKTTVLLDVRTPEEFAGGHIAGAQLLPYDGITVKTAAGVIAKKTSTIIVYCRSGRRSALAATTLRDLGYKTVWDLGGIIDWPYGIEK